MKYQVYLKSCGNIDYGQSPFMEVAPSQLVDSDTIQGCQEAVCEYIDDNDLGSGNWCGGQVYEEGVGYIGRVAYNGRFFSNDTEYGKE